MARPKAIDYTQAQSEMVALNRTGKLNDSMVNRFAVRGEYTHVVAALALKADVKVEAIAPLLEADRMYGLIVACKAAWRELVDHDDDRPQSARLPTGHATRTRPMRGDL